MLNSGETTRSRLTQHYSIGQLHTGCKTDFWHTVRELQFDDENYDAIPSIRLEWKYHMHFCLLCDQVIHYEINVNIVAYIETKQFSRELL